jgi:hypothetical protein
LTAAFLATGFLAAGFLAAGFFAGVDRVGAMAHRRRSPPRAQPRREAVQVDPRRAAIDPTSPPAPARGSSLPRRIDEDVDADEHVDVVGGGPRVPGDVPRVVERRRAHEAGVAGGDLAEAPGQVAKPEDGVAANELVAVVASARRHIRRTVA